MEKIITSLHMSEYWDENAHDKEWETVYAYMLPGCTHCNTLKELFNRAKIEYVPQLIGEGITMEEFHERYPDIREFPYVVINRKPVGGLVETAKLFLEKGLVSPPQRNKKIVNS